MVIQLIDTNIKMIKAWEHYFGGVPNVVIKHGDIFSLETDCIVSPANSFGFMDGSLDLVISNKVGWRTQEKLQETIKNNYEGELLVGQAVLIETEFDDIPYCISAPTMRVPSIIKGTVNVYLAARATFRVLQKNEHITKVTISGLGTGCGKMDFDTCAKQMKIAYLDVFNSLLTYPTSWGDAQSIHFEIL